MKRLPLIQQLLDAPGAPLANWREIVQEINNEFGRARTEDDRVGLLATFKATMDIVEKAVAPEELRAFQDARQKYYKIFIVQELLGSENVSVETLDAITRREINARRMAPGEGVLRIAAWGSVGTYRRRARLGEMAARRGRNPTRVCQRLLARIRRA